MNWMMTTRNWKIATNKSTRGAVGFEDRGWERIGVQLQRLPFSCHESLLMNVENRLVIELEL